MPAKSEKQRRFMAAVANNPKFAEKAGVPRSVGEEFMKKSKGYMGGGMMKRYAGGGKLDMVEKDGKMVPFYAADGKGKMKAGGKVMKYAKGDMIIGGVGGAPGDEITRGTPMPREREIREGIPNKRMMETQFELEGGEQASKKRMKKKPAKKMGGGKIKGYKHGGKVRGCGMAKQGVRPVKMITMKGA